MGTMIQRHKLTEADFRGERFAASRAAICGQQRSARADAARRHRARSTAQYLEAGATSSRRTRSAAPRSRRPTTALESIVYELNLEGARLARAACDEWTARTPDRPRFVAGSMGPTNRILSISPDVNNPAFRTMTFDELREAYEEQVRGLIDGGVRSAAARDDRRHAQRQGRASSRSKKCSRRRASALPLMISVTITDRSGRTLSGQTIDAFWVSIAHARPFSVGINCALGARDMRPYLAELARHRRLLRQLLSERRPAERVRRVRRAAAPTPAATCASSPTSGFVNIVGGCCGTTPDHIAAIARGRRRTCRRGTFTTDTDTEPSAHVPARHLRSSSSRSSPASRR